MLMLDSTKTNNYIEQILNCKTVFQVWQKYVTILSDFDFDRIIYATTNLSKSGLNEGFRVYCTMEGRNNTSRFS